MDKYFFFFKQTTAYEFRLSRVGSGMCIRDSPCDVGRVEWTDGDGQPHADCWVVNASVGTTAAANWSFNHPNGALRGLKRSSTGLAIAYASLEAVLPHPPDAAITVS